jgi:hypothetical protein
MIKLEKYDGTKTYMFPNGAIATPDVVRAQYPAIELFPHVIEVNGNVLQAIMELGALRGIHNIDENLPEADAISAIQTIINTPAPAPEVSAEERIASALEFQNLLSM